MAIYLKISPHSWNIMALYLLFISHLWAILLLLLLITLCSWSLVIIWSYVVCGWTILIYPQTSPHSRNNGTVPSLYHTSVGYAILLLFLLYPLLLVILWSSFDWLFYVLFVEWDSDGSRKKDEKNLITKCRPTDAHGYVYIGLMLAICVGHLMSVGAKSKNPKNNLVLLFGFPPVTFLIPNRFQCVISQMKENKFLIKFIIYYFRVGVMPFK